MPSVIDTPISQPARRVSSEPCTRPLARCRRMPVLHGTRPRWRWLYTLGHQTESAIDRLAREKPYRYLLASLW